MGSYLAYKLSPACRSRLLTIQPPSFDRVTCDHVTIEFGLDLARLKALHQELKGTKTVSVVGYLGGEHVECFMVELDGDPQRPGGGYYHVTLSYERPDSAVSSNKLLSQAMPNKAYRSKPFNYYQLKAELEGEFKLLR